MVINRTICCGKGPGAAKDGTHSSGSDTRVHSCVENLKVHANGSAESATFNGGDSRVRAHNYCNSCQTSNWILKNYERFTYSDFFLNIRDVAVTRNLNSWAKVYIKLLTQVV